LLNFSTFAYDAPLMNLNDIAERSPGFLWRLQDENGNATDIKRDGDPRALLNLSTWQTPENLAHYVFNTLHAQFYKRGPEWFEVPSTPHFVIWTIPEGHIPSQEEALEKLAELTQNGPTEHIYGWDALPSAKAFKDKRCA